ncbi:MAG: HIT domain-containing protein [Candidatus Brocadiia bacterium]
MSDCIFCKIVSGQLPSTKLYEDADALVIMDINPIASGHALLLSKTHYVTLTDAPAGHLASLSAVLLKVVPAILKGTGAEGFNIIQNNQRCAGQLVPHLHFHIVPRKTDDGIRFSRPPSPAAKAEINTMAEAIKKQLI